MYQTVYLFLRICHEKPALAYSENPPQLPLHPQSNLILLGCSSVHDCGFQEPITPGCEWCSTALLLHLKGLYWIVTTEGAEYCLIS